MFGRFCVLAALAGVALLAGCSAGQTVSQAPGAGALSARVSPDKDCAGQGGVKVTPCPVHLNKHTQQGIVVTVKVRHIADSEIGSINSCFNGYNCYNAQRVSGSQTKWLITSGTSCGSADVEFDATNGHGDFLGEYFLKVSNKYCP